MTKTIGTYSREILTKSFGRNARIGLPKDIRETHDMVQLIVKFDGLPLLDRVYNVADIQHLFMDTESDTRIAIRDLLLLNGVK